MRNTAKPSARKHQVQRFAPFSGWPVSSIPRYACFANAPASSSYDPANAAEAFCTTLANCPVLSDKPNTSLKKVWIVAYDIWHADF